MGPSVWASVALGNVGASVKASLGVHIIHGEGCGAGPGGGINQTFKSKGGGGKGLCMAIYVYDYHGRASSTTKSNHDSLKKEPSKADDLTRRVLDGWYKRFHHTDWNFSSSCCFLQTRLKILPVLTHSSHLLVV
jgi:hypothetical protein